MMPPSVPPGQGSDAPVATRSDPAPATSAVRPMHLVAVAVAVAGGALATLLVLDARPSAGGAVAPVAPSGVVPPAPPAAPVIDPSAPPKWSSKGQARWVNPSRRTAAFEVAAERPIAVWNGVVTPVLVVRCTNRRVDAFVYTNSAARIEPEDDNHTVKLVFDEDAAIHERWADALEHDALFAPEGRALADRLASARTFRFTFTPHNAPPATALFDVRGLQKTMAASRACAK